MLLASSFANHVASMLSDLNTHASRVDLQLHPSQTKIFHDGHGFTHRQRPPAAIHVDNMTIEVIPPYRYAKYFGERMQFSGQHSADLDNWIAASWRKFHLLKQELTDRSHFLRDQLRLFKGTITPTI
eukprot:6847407-Pyramimonas_sp.AAC.1